jgi:hypothetical protein
MSCTDWEMLQAYRSWKREYGDKWEEKFRQRFQTEMIQQRDTHFYVGTIHQHPGSWIIVGLFYPPFGDGQHDLFGSTNI